MPKPNQNMSVTEMKSYIRTHKINHPEVRLGMKRAQLISGLKKAGHWQEVSKQKRTREKQKGTLSIGQKPKTAVRVNTGNIAKGKVLKSAPKRAEAGTTTAPTKWDPMNSPNAPMDEWFPCMVFTDTGKNPKPYEAKYVNQKYWSRGKVQIFTDFVVLIRSSSYPKGIIAAGDMGHLDYGSDRRVSQFRFSKETITVTYVLGT